MFYSELGVKVRRESEGERVKCEMFCLIKHSHFQCSCLVEDLYIYSQNTN